MLPVIVIICLVLLISGIVVLVVSGVNRSERAKYLTAAGNTLREEYLDYSLQNSIAGGNTALPEGKKLMVYIKTKCNKKKIQYVFNPEKSILIGRDKHESNIYINDNTVSKKHCRIFLEDGQVYLEDLNASNGTVVERGLFKKYGVYGNSRFLLKSNDRIIIGTGMLKVILFYYDMSTM